MRRRTRLGRVLGIAGIAAITLLILGNLAWLYAMRTPIGGQYYGWRCTKSGIELKWLPGRQRAYVHLPRAYDSAQHDWVLHHPPSTRPITWLDRVLYEPPDPTDVFAQALISGDSPSEALLAAYLLESETISHRALGQLKLRLKPGSGSSTFSRSADLGPALIAASDSESAGRAAERLEALRAWRKEGAMQPTEDDGGLRAGGNDAGEGADE